MTIARILAFILWILSFLIIWPVAAQDAEMTNIAIERSSNVATNSIHRPYTDDPVRLCEALRSLWSSSGSKKGMKLLVWFRQRAERYIGVSIH
jgi:hypothetical protein